MEQDQRRNAVWVTQLSPLALALVGDSVFDLFIRSRLAMRKNESAHKMHVRAISYVSAGAQSKIANELYGILNDEEKAIFRRGRNSKSATIPKNADVLEYRRATAFEAVLGYLHLLNKQVRLNELLNIAAEVIEKEDTEVTNGK
jgi:ribonuclease-3 family protein